MSEWIAKSTAYKPKILDDSDKDKNLQQIYSEILSLGYETDKGTTHNYIDSYSSLFEPYRHQEINLLEIGINFGYSLALWRKYFSKAKIYGIDNRDVLKFNEGVNTLFFDANDKSIVEKFYKDLNFDIIIDDASHEISHQLLRFPIYFPKLKSGGIYIIEDVQSLDDDSYLLKQLNQNIEILDLRKIKNRYDDVLVVCKK